MRNLAYPVQAPPGVPCALKTMPKNVSFIVTEALDDVSWTVTEALTDVPCTVTEALMLSVPKSLLRQSVYLPESVG